MQSHDERLVDVRIVSQLTGIKVRTLRKWRTEGRGPAAVRIEGRLVRYSLKVVKDWLQEQPRLTSDDKTGVAG